MNKKERGVVHELLRVGIRDVVLANLSTHHLPIIFPQRIINLDQHRVNFLKENFKTSKDIKTLFINKMKKERGVVNELPRVGKHDVVLARPNSRHHPKIHPNNKKILTSTR